MSRTIRNKDYTIFGMCGETMGRDGDTLSCSKAYRQHKRQMRRSRRRAEHIAVDAGEEVPEWKKEDAWWW